MSTFSLKKKLGVDTKMHQKEKFEQYSSPTSEIQSLHKNTKQFFIEMQIYPFQLRKLFQSFWCHFDKPVVTGSSQVKSCKKLWKGKDDEENMDSWNNRIISYLIMKNYRITENY